MIFAGISMAANVVLSLALFLTIGATGIAIAATFAGWLNVALLAIALRRRAELALDQTFRRRFLGIVAASAVMGMVVFALVEFFGSWFAPSSGFLAQVAALTTLVGAGFVVYLAAAHLFGATHYRELIRT